MAVQGLVAGVNFALLVSFGLLIWLLVIKVQETAPPILDSSHRPVYALPSSRPVTRRLQPGHTPWNTTLSFSGLSAVQLIEGLNATLPELNGSSAEDLDCAQRDCALAVGAFATQVGYWACHLSAVCTSLA